MVDEGALPMAWLLRQCLGLGTRVSFLDLGVHCPLSSLSSTRLQSPCQAPSWAMGLGEGSSWVAGGMLLGMPQV